MKLPWAEQSDKDKTTSSPLPTPQFAADNTTDNKSVGNGTALVCTFLPGPLTEAALTFLIKISDQMLQNVIMVVLLLAIFFHTGQRGPETPLRYDTGTVFNFEYLIKQWSAFFC